MLWLSLRRFKKRIECSRAASRLRSIPDIAGDLLKDKSKAKAEDVELSSTWHAERVRHCLLRGFVLSFCRKAGNFYERAGDSYCCCR
jgi:hypothetical protein